MLRVSLASRVGHREKRLQARQADFVQRFGGRGQDRYRRVPCMGVPPIPLSVVDAVLKVSKNILGWLAGFGF